MKTAVEWVKMQLEIRSGIKEITVDSKTFEELCEQAKEMEQEQSIDFARLCLNKAKDLDILTAFMNTQQYYNETFKQQEQ